MYIFDKSPQSNTINQTPKDQIDRPIFIIRDVLNKLDINAQNTRFPRQVLKRFIHITQETVNDTRVQKKIFYPVSYLLVITFLALLSGADTWTEIEGFAKEQRKLLKRVLPRYYGTPSHDTYRRVLGMLNVEELGEAVTKFIMESMQAIKKALKIKEEGYRLINVDGKEARGSGRKYNSDKKVANLQTLNVYDASNGICLVSRPINRKNGEISATQEILSRMELKGSIVTFDALNTQKKTIRAISGNKGEYVGGLKGNQHLFYDEVVEFFTEEELEKIEKKGENYYTYKEKAHNRIEKRSYYLTTDIKWFTEIEEWEKLKAFVCYIYKGQDLVSGKETVERRYYITSLSNVKVVADAIRSHWSIENQLHWHLDTSFSEDEDGTMDKKAFNNLSIIRKLALSVCKLMQPTRKSRVGLKTIRKIFGWSLEKQLREMLSIFEIGEIEEAMKRSAEKEKKYNEGEKEIYDQNRLRL